SREGSSHSLLTRIRDEISAAAALEILKAHHLARHLEIVAVDRVVPALDVDRAAPARLAQDRDDVRPIRIAKTRRAVPNAVASRAGALGFDDVPVDRRVLAVDVIDAADPLAELGQGIDEAHHLVAGL